MSHIASLPEIQVPKTSFWRGLFFGPRTIHRDIQDVFFGILAPLLCFAYDPGVMFGGPLSQGLQSMAPLLVVAVAFLSMLALLALLVLGGRSGMFDAVLAGVLLAGGVVAGLVGLGLLPLAVMLVMVLIGVLGFLPLFASIVCFRNAARVLATPAGWKRRWLSTATAVLVLLLGAAYQVGADRALDALVADIARTGSPAAIARLERWRTLLPRREMARRGVILLNHDGDPRGDQYGIAYLRVTGTALPGEEAD